VVAQLTNLTKQAFTQQLSTRGPQFPRRCKESPMSNLRWKTKNCVGAIAAVALIFPNLAFAQLQTATTQVEQPNRIVIEYVAPKNLDLQDLYEVVKIRGALEKSRRY
jgi:hypothetical protein